MPPAARDALDPALGGPALRNPVGTHVPVGKGLVAGALASARAIGCETLQVFVGNPRGWALSAGDPREDARFREACAESGTRVFIHAPYLVNLGSPTAATYEKSVATVAHTLRRAVEIGGPGRLRLVHANDSMDVRGAFKDRHQTIGDGHIGVDAFRDLFAHASTAGVPFILETPGSREPGNADIPLLKRLRSEAATP